jgi:hypothetical protein
MIHDRPPTSCGRIEKSMTLRMRAPSPCRFAGHLAIAADKMKRSRSTTGAEAAFRRVEWYALPGQLGNLSRS